MIVGLGIDITEIHRISAMLSRWGDRFADRVFTPGERAFADRRGDPARHYAARFAAKEAALKALGVPSGLSWHEMEITGGGRSAPQLRLSGRALEAAEALGARVVHVSVTHGQDHAAAVVIAESDGPEQGRTG